MTSHVGEHVIFIDEMRNEHHALVENDFGGELKDNPTINVVYIAMENGTDNYGFQKKHASSIVHISYNDANAYCWKRESE